MATDLRPPGVCGFIAAAVPVGSVLVMDPIGLAPFGPAKWAVVSSLVLALGACVLGRRTTSARLPLVLWGVFLLVAGSSAAVGVDPLYAWTGTPERHFGVIAWVLCAVAFASGRVLSHSEIRLFAHAAAIVTGLVGAWAVAEALGWHPIALNGIGDRPGASFGSSAYLGAALALLCPAATGLAFARRSTLLATAAVTGWVALVLTGARASWVGAIMAALVWALARRVPVTSKTPATGNSIMRPPIRRRSIRSVNTTSTPTEAMRKMSNSIDSEGPTIMETRLRMASSPWAAGMGML